MSVVQEQARHKDPAQNKQQWDQAFFLQQKLAKTIQLREFGLFFQLEQSDHHQQPNHQDFDIHYYHIKLLSKILSFLRAGISDALGKTIENVRIERECGCGFEDLLVNGEFHKAVWPTKERDTSMKESEDRSQNTVTNHDAHVFNSCIMPIRSKV